MDAARDLLSRVGETPGVGEELGERHVEECEILLPAGVGWVVSDETAQILDRSFDQLEGRRALAESRHELRLVTTDHGQGAAPLAVSLVALGQIVEQLVGGSVLGQGLLRTPRRRESKPSTSDRRRVAPVAQRGRSLTRQLADDREIGPEVFQRLPGLTEPVEDDTELVVGHRQIPPPRRVVRLARHQATADVEGFGEGVSGPFEITPRLVDRPQVAQRVRGFELPLGIVGTLGA